MLASAPSTNPIPHQQGRPRLPYEDAPVIEAWPFDLSDEDPAPREPRRRIVTWPLVAIFALALLALAAAVWVGTRVGEDTTRTAQAAVTTSAATVSAAAVAAPADLPGGATTAPPQPGAGGDADEGFLTAMMDGLIIPAHGDGTTLLTQAGLTCESLNAGDFSWSGAKAVLVGRGWLPGDADYFLTVTTATYCPDQFQQVASGR